MSCHLWRPVDRRKPTVLGVSPFALYPPRHGGARRMFELYRRLLPRWNVLLLSDEGVSYLDVPVSWRQQRPDALFTVSGRVESGPLQHTRIGRIESHSREGLRRAMDYLLEEYSVDVVVIEYVELAGLVRHRTDNLPWVLDLHDVLCDGSDPEADAYEYALLDRFDALIVTSPEDGELLQRPGHLVENGVDTAALACPPSPGNGRILFPGPFRYPPNLEGAREFAAVAFPAIRRSHPESTLRILAGEGAGARVAAEPAFAQPGIELVEEHRDIRTELAGASMTINPVHGIRGSALKVAESIAAGRVCVATDEGSRGYAALGIESLLQVPDVAGMVAPILDLLAAEERRHRLEEGGRAGVAHLDWARLAARFSDILEETLR